MEIIWQQIVGLFVLAIPIACITRTVITEELFRLPREAIVRKCEECENWFTRNVKYLFSCEYCFSHYVTLGALTVTRFRLLYPDWRGYVVSFFALVFVANIYLNLYSRLRVQLSADKKDVEAKTAMIEKLTTDSQARIPETQSRELREAHEGNTKNH